MQDRRLGDVIDDFLVKFRRLTNYSIVSLMNGAAAKVRCRTCYSDHDYRNEIAPPSKKELAKQKDLFAAVLAGNASMLTDAPPATESEPESDGATAAAPKKARAVRKK